MTIFCYDKTFEGLLTCIFEAYSQKDFPELLLPIGAPLPLFCDHHFTVVTDTAKADRVWQSLPRRLSSSAIREIHYCWLSELSDIDLNIFRYIRKAIDAGNGYEGNFADADVLQLAHVYKKVSYEAHRLLQFARFQKTADGTYFAPMEPEFNTLPLAVHHFKDRFADQKFIIYDMHRHYGFYYDLHTTTEVTLTDDARLVTDGILSADIADADEPKYRQLWQSYYHTIAIKERLNPRKQRQDMPVRYWKYLTEMK